MPIIFVGTKKDIINESCIQNNLIEQILEKYNFCDYFETSSKTDSGVTFVGCLVSEIRFHPVDWVIFVPAVLTVVVALS